MAISNAMVITMRADQQDYQGTHMVVDVAAKLQIPYVSIVANQVPANLDLDQLKADVENEFQLKVDQALYHTNDLLHLASSGIFALQFPRHRLSEQFLELVDRLEKPLLELRGQPHS